MAMVTQQGKTGDGFQFPGEGADKVKWVHDGSMDHKGELPIRSSTGVWKASIFIIAIEFSERLSYFGLATSLIIYMTTVIHEDLETAAKSVNYWTGVTTMMPLLGGFLADAYLGRFFTVLASSTVYLLGLILLTMSRIVPCLKPCIGDTCEETRKVHEVVFFVAIYLVSVGTGGHKPSLESFGADQFDDDHSTERREKLSYFNWWNSGLCAGLLLGVTVIVYLQDRVSWAAADGVLSVVMAASTVIFLVGRPFYRYRRPGGSPLMPMLQVVVAAVAKRGLPSPSDASELYEVLNWHKSQGRVLCHSDNLKFLDKAAIIEGDKDYSVQKRSMNPWRLATVTQVEELKLLLNMVPIWLATLPFGICVAQLSTFFIKQATAMDRTLQTFVIPSASIYSLGAVGMIVAVTIYDKLLIPKLRKATNIERGITILQRIGTGMVIVSAGMAIAAVVERKRLRSLDPISVFWLAPQFLVLGVGDAFTLVGMQEFFYEQVPDSMRSLGIAFYLSVLGAASFLSSLLITVVDRVTESVGEKKSWIGKDVNSSRLDYFFWLLTGMNAANLCVFVVLAKRYRYKTVHRGTAGDEDGTAIGG